MTNLKVSTLRPGLLVSLATSVTGNVSYAKETIEAETEVEGSPGKMRAKWETTRYTADAAEHEAAIKVRGKARSLITSVCAKSKFGLLCPENMIPEFDKAVGEAERLVEAFNAQATITTVGLYVVAGNVSPDDARAVKAIKAEISALMEVMANGVKNLDPQAIREAALKAKSVAQMLSPRAEAEVAAAVQAARKAATAIKAAGETAAQEVDLLAVRAITEARMAFLDLDGEQAVQAPVEVGLGIDLMPDEEPKGEEPKGAKPAAVAPVELEF
jgi:hypothetical protein